MLEIAILNDREHLQLTVKEKSFSIGSDPKNNLIAVDDEYVSKFQCQIELIGETAETIKIRVTNLGGSMVLGNSSRIHHLVTKELTLPCSLGAGETQIQICKTQTSCSIDHTIAQLDTLGASSETEIAEHKSRNEVAPSSEILSSWFESLGQLQRSTAGQSQFFKLAARCVYNPGGLDGCIILLRQNNDWSIVAQHIPYPTESIGFYKDLVQNALETKRPIYHDASEMGSDHSNDFCHTAVVCPVVDNSNQVVAMVYGFRNNRLTASRKGIRKLEAKYVSLIADSISAGLIRLTNEADRARQRVLLEQAFSPEVAAQLEANPDILNGHEREISVLFADLRGFCRISESIGAKTTYQLLTDVMNRFTEIIRDHRGVVIDYYGDGLSAFWNAPVDQPDHALLAVQAGMAINKEMAELNEVWSVEIGTRLRVGIGIHTGNAQVGNSGSQNRLKYGPQGSTVNIASRLEQTTKKLGTNVVISGDTADRLDGSIITQRICKAQLAGIQNPTSIFTPVASTDYSKSTEYYLCYDKALNYFEAGEYYEALEILSSMADSPQTAQPMLSFLLEEINSHLGSANNTAANEEQLKHSSTVEFSK